MSALEQGQELNDVRGPLSGPYGEQTMAKVGHDRTTKIVVGQLAGPMGFYDVAEVWFGDEVAMLLPLHLMEQINITPEPSTPTTKPK